MGIFGRLCRFGEGDNLGTCSLPLEDQDWRINEHNIRKLLRHLGEIQGVCPPSLTIKGNQANWRQCALNLWFSWSQSGLNHYFLGSRWSLPLRINKVDQELIGFNFGRFYDPFDASRFHFHSICIPFHPMPFFSILLGFSV